ncbi:MAG TPA: M9 family metallopeptidase [Chiayiivirga sp.]|nr:M9 family metallopeptidase [Chiayiivirga sp.]
MKFLSSLRRLASALCLVAVAAPALAANGAHAPIPPPTASLTARVDHAMAHAQREALTPDLLPPLSSSREHLRHNARHAPQAKSTLACDATIFANASGAALVSAVKNSTVDCINALFSIGGAQGALVFPEAKMVTIANAMYADAGSYAGNNNGKMLQLVLFLRAGYFIQWYNPEVGDYGAPLTNAIGPALDAFVANAHFQDVNDDHGEILAEFVTLIDSAGENTHQIATLKGILDRYGPSYHAYWYMKSAVNGVFTVLFRGHYLDDFRAAVQVSPGSALLDSLVDFITNNKTADIGSDREYLLQNAAAELARFLNPGPWYGYPTTFHDLVHPKAKGVLDQFSLTGYGSGVYVRMAGVIDYFDTAHCAYFGLCTFAQDLEDYVLPAANARTCSPTLKVRSQALTSAQMDWVCATIAQEEGFFHTKIGTQPSNPVANDHNDQLEMVIFHSSTDYETYAGTIFGIDTNNGGMYLEGDPSVVGNQARFVAYEAEWLRPTFDVWNLTHEYTHYLDGRFIWHGMFGEYPMTAPYSGVWFFEGFGEYMSYTFRNLVYDTAVIEAANPDKFTFSQLLDTVYSTDYARTYQWGYMAVRFMFERHLTDINTMIALTRQGDYAPGYQNWLDAIRNSYNAEFRAWVVCFRDGNGDTSACGGEVPPLPDPIFDDGFEGDAGTVPPTDLPECADSANGRLDNDCKISALSAPRPVDREWLTILVPAGTSAITITTQGGTGDADLYHKAGGWPSDTVFDHSSNTVGNAETLSIQNPAAGWHYLMLKPKSDAFDAVEASAHWQ